MKVIIDFIPNHTSDLHPWFQASLKNESDFADYYVWREANETSGTRSPPNNWKSVFGGSAWTWSEQRNKYYLHQFLDKQPDLNLRNPNVKKSLEEVLRFWLKKKVDGIRIDAASHLFEDENFEDEKESSVKSGTVNDYNTLEHDKTKSQPENYELLKEWRKIVKAAGLKKIILSEAYDTTENLLKYYGNSKEPIIDLPFNFKLVDMNFTTNAGKLKEEIESWINATESLNWAKDAKPPGPWSAWVTGNHDKSRLVSRLGNRRLADALLMITFLIPRNTPVIYYGDEIGLEDQPVVPDKARNEGDSSRFAYRSPMQWNANTTSAGFSDNETTIPWLYVQSSHTTFNVESENNANTSSHLKVFKSLVKLRQEQAETILLGETKFPSLDTNEVFVLTRVSKGYNGYLLAINFNTTRTNKVKLQETYLPTKGKIILTDSQSPIDLLGTQIELSELELQPSQSILIELEAQTD